MIKFIIGFYMRKKYIDAFMLFKWTDDMMYTFMQLKR